MHNTLNRIQGAFGFFTTVAFVLAAFIAATDFYNPRTPSGTLNPENVQVVKGRPHYYSSKKEEYAIIKFSMDADLSSLFTWNTKQLFVYVTAEWPAANANETNEAVIWDAIITNPSADHLQNIGPAAMKKLKKSSAGKKVDRNRQDILPHAISQEVVNIAFRGLLKLKNQKPKYQITHPSGKIAEVENVKLRLHYNVQPWVGALTWNTEQNHLVWNALKGGISAAFDLPAIKKKKT